MLVDDEVLEILELEHQGEVELLADLLQCDNIQLLQLLIHEHEVDEVIDEQVELERQVLLS